MMAAAYVVAAEVEFCLQMQQNWSTDSAVNFRSDGRLFRNDRPATMKLWGLKPICKAHSVICVPDSVSAASSSSSPDIYMILSTLLLPLDCSTSHFFWVYAVHSKLGAFLTIPVMCHINERFTYLLTCLMAVIMEAALLWHKQAVQRVKFSETVCKNL